MTTRQDTSEEGRWSREQDESDVAKERSVEAERKASKEPGVSQYP